MTTFLFTDATLNIRSNNTPKQHRKDLNLVAAHADICGLQEVQTKAAIRTLKWWVRRHRKWGVVWGGECPVIYRKDKVKKARNHVVITDNGKEGVNPQRVINYVIFVYKHLVLTYANHHAEHEYTHNHTDSANYDYKVKAAKRGLDKLAEMNADRIGGDFNALRLNREEPWYPFRFNNNFNLKSNGLDYIGWRSDWNWYLRRPRWLPAESDHNLFLVDVYFK